MHSFSPSGSTFAQHLFHVSEQVRHLTPEKLEQFQSAFFYWKEAAVRADSIRTRERMWLTFLLLRYTGARLGEVLALDDTTAFDAQHCIVRIGTEGKLRELSLPEQVFEEIEKGLKGPVLSHLRGTVFHLDAGYFRKACYARGEECGLSRELTCPNVLRNSRAVELLRSGVPLPVVKDILGQSSLQLTACFQQFSEHDTALMLRLTQQDMSRRHSARNMFLGHVVEITHDVVMSEVLLETASGMKICAVITSESLRSLQLENGSPVVASVKAPLVNLLESGCVHSGGTRNHFCGSVTNIQESSVITEVTGVLADGTKVCAIVSAKDIEGLQLSVEQKVEFWFTSLSVVLSAIQL